MGLISTERQRMQRRPQWKIDYRKKGKEYETLVKKGEGALRRGDREKAARYYMKARKAWAERNTIMEKHLMEDLAWERTSIEMNKEELKQTKNERRYLDILKRDMKESKKRIRQYREAIQAMRKEIPKSMYRVDTQRLVPGKQIEIIGMRHVIYGFLGNTYDSNLKELTQQIGKKLKRGDSILVEMSPLFLAYCKEKNRIFRAKKAVTYEPPRRFPREIREDLKKASERWFEGLKEIEMEKKRYKLEPSQVSWRKKRLKERILNSEGFSIDPLGMGSASISYFGVRLVEYLQRKGIEIIPMDSPYSHKAADKIRKTHIELVRKLKEEEMKKNNDWNKIEKLRERVMESYIKYQTLIMPFREKSWMRTLNQAMKGKNPPRVVLVGMHHVPKMVRRINAVGYHAVYEWLPKIAAGVREAYRLDAERRKAKIIQRKRKQGKKMQKNKTRRLKK